MTIGKTAHLIIFGALSIAAPSCGSAQSAADLVAMAFDAALDSAPDAQSPIGDPVGAGVSVIVEPGDKGSALLAALNSAKKSIHMTMYLLTDSDIRNALIARHKAGVDVKVLLNKTFPPGTTIDNSSAYSALHSAGVSVAWAPSTFTYTHEKCVVIDGATAWIMTMNATNSAPTSNREFLAVDTLSGDVSEAEAQFAADFANRAYTPVGNLLLSPVNSRSRILDLISSAHTTLDFEDEELSDTAVVAALCSATARGVRVRGILAGGSTSSAEHTAVTQLKACGVTMVSLDKPYIHAKAIAVDGAKVYVGSENLTAVSLDENREMGLIITTTAAYAAVANTVAADIAAGTAL